jgi:hypothetical protein
VFELSDPDDNNVRPLLFAIRQFSKVHIKWAALFQLLMRLDWRLSSPIFLGLVLHRC